MAKRKPKKDVPYIKIAYIGGGSRGWAHTLMGDLTLCGRLTGEVRLYDIDRPMALLNARWGRRLNESPDAKSTWNYTVPRTLAEALKEADFVVASIQPGPVEMVADDVGIPAKYGIIHPVGDTVGPAGLVRGLRAVPEYATIARAIARHCPNAWVINYTNPMSICTRTLYKVFPDIKAFGCCHGVFAAQDRLGQLVAKHYGVRKPSRRRIRLNVLGVNHFTWADSARYEQIDLLKLYDRHWRREGMVRKITPQEIEQMDYFQTKGQVTNDLWRRFGVLPAISDRHSVEFLPWYLKDEKTANRWGIKLTPVSFRIKRYYQAPKQFRRQLAGKKPLRVKPSSEEAVEQMLAVLGLGDLYTNVNLPNVGQIDSLPRQAIVETNAYFTEDSVKPEFSGRLPAGVEAWVARTVSNQEMIVEAALATDKHLAFQAILNDPLMTLTTDKAWKMFNEMLKATKAMLGGWRI